MAPKEVIFALFMMNILASLPSAALGGRRIFGKYAAPARSMAKDYSSKGTGLHCEQVGSTNVDHSRMLKVNTNDYGTYDPTPSLSQPPFKLIPN